MSSEIKFRDRDGVYYKHPERSCKKCLKYPCIENMQEKLFSDFASYGCVYYEDENVFDICLNKK